MASRSGHAGPVTTSILVYGIGHNELELVLRGIGRRLGLRPGQADWIDFPAIVDRTWAA